MASLPIQNSQKAVVSSNTQAGRADSPGVPPVFHNKELYRTQASWLVDLVPDKLIVQEKTVTVTHRDLLSANTETIPIKDIGRVVYMDTPIFAGVDILGKNTAHELKIKGLSKAEARKATELIESLMLKEINVEQETTIWRQMDSSSDEEDEAPPPGTKAHSKEE